MKIIPIALLLCFCSFEMSGQNIPKLRISEDRKYLVTSNNEAFFWLGGTAWELIHRLNKEEVNFYLNDRAINTIEFEPWSSGRCSDFILVIMDVNSGYDISSLHN